MTDFLSLYSLVSISLIVLFVPGFFLSFLFFDRGNIDVIERIALSFALSIAVIPLIVFYVSLLGSTIQVGTVLFAISIILWIAISVFAWQIVRRRIKHERKNKHYRN